MKQFLQPIINLIKSHPKRSLIIAISSIIILLALLWPSPQSPALDTPAFPDQPSSQPPPTDSFGQLIDQSADTIDPDSTIPPDSSPAPAYYLNKILSLENVTGYSWQNQNLIYSTPDGIFLAGSNQPLLEASIDFITWSANGQAIYQSNAQWFHFQTPSASPSTISFTGRQPFLSPSGQYLATLNNYDIFILNLDSLISTTITLEYQPQTLKWSISSTHLVVAGTDKISLLTPQGDTLTSIFQSPSHQLLAISPNGDQLALADSDQLQLVHLNDPDNPAIISFDPDSDLLAHWLNQGLFIIETTAPDGLGRRADGLWKISSDNQKTLLTTSLPIPNKLNNDITLYPNPDQTIIPLVENQKTLWMISLKPNQFPSYTAKGLFFFPIIPRGH